MIIDVALTANGFSSFHILKLRSSFIGQKILSMN